MMRKRLPILLTLLMLLLAAPALSQNALPEAVERDVLDRFAPFGSKGIAAHCLTWRNDTVVLMRGERDDLALYVYEQAQDGSWAYRYENHNISLRAEGPVTLTAHEESFTGWRSGDMLPPGFTIRTDNETLVFSWSDREKDYLLVEYEARGKRNVRCEYVHSSMFVPIVYFENADWTDMTAVIAFDGSAQHAQWLCLSGMAGARIDPLFIEETPKFSMPETGLTVVRLIDSAVFPVYSGPGTQYHRAANGKASVSAKDSFGVLGKTGEWLMVIYDISNTRARVGYIRCTENPRLEEAAALIPESDFSHFENVFTIKKLPLWDDPINRTNPLCTLDKNTEVIYLERCGDLAYVEVTVGGRRMRGFVEDASLGNG